MISLERTLFSYFENTKNYIRAQPLNLGGVASSGGGRGGPPGGFYGFLPQVRVAYDYAELAYSGPSIPVPSGISLSLVDNLNHIRFRIGVLETASGGGTGGTGRIDIYKNSVMVASGITSLNVVGDLNVTAIGTQATIEYPISYSEYYSAIAPTTNFITTFIFYSGSLKLYYNGLRQFNTDYTEDSGNLGFTFTLPVPSGSFVVADYLYFNSIQPSGLISGWGAFWGMPWGT